MSLHGYFIKNVGQNRGRPRIWLENSEVSSAGLQPGDRYDIHMKEGVVTLQANPDGSRVVSSKQRGEKAYPVIDINSREVLALFDGMAAIRLVQREGQIYLLPLASEVKKKERLNRLRYKIENKIPLTIGSLSHGAGLLSKAVHEGLQAAGIQTEKGLVNEIRPELLEHARSGSDWSPRTIPVAAPMQEFAFDDAATRLIPKQDGLEAGLPCSGASVGGRARRGTAMAEEHPLVGHLIVAALMIIARANPAFILMENVIPYSSSASAAILRNQLADLGYVTHETILKGSDFNAMEHRDRWCMVAVTEGMSFDWSMLQLPEAKTMTLSDILDDIPEDSPLWSEMRGLKEKEIRDLAEGKGFRMQVFTETDIKVNTLTKGYAKVRSTDPKLAHPTDPNLLRQFTANEHARIKQWPPSVIEGFSNTVAHEVLGQAIVKDPFVAAAKLLGQFVLDFGHDRKSFTASHLIQAIHDTIQDTASEVVSEILQPIAGVTYEGRITANDAGALIQDIGNGVGILHKASAFPEVALGESVRVRYPSKSAVPTVLQLEQPAPAVTSSLVAAQAQAAREAQNQQMSMFPTHEPTREESRPRPSFGPRF